MKSGIQKSHSFKKEREREIRDGMKHTLTFAQIKMCIFNSKVEVKRAMNSQNLLFNEEKIFALNCI